MPSAVRECDVLVIGGGPAGLCAALAASSCGAGVIMAERDGHLGGQLAKQTHKFFGFARQHSGERGFLIARRLAGEAETRDNIEILLETPVLGIYEDGVATLLHRGSHVKLKPKKIIAACGAAENFLAFPGNDLPGVFSAGAAETLINAQGILPGKRALMVGAGNVGLMVAYQLLQAGMEVAAVIDHAPQTGGYWVHAAKLRRCGVPILNSHAIKAACGREQVEGAVICQVDEKRRPLPGTERRVDCDVICLAAGLSPLGGLCRQAGCHMVYIPELSGHVPVTDECLQTTKEGFYVAGDGGGVEEATTAMEEGKIAGLAAAISLGYGGAAAQEVLEEAAAELKRLREGPLSERIRRGRAALRFSAT
ncbi:MAG: NAD(P)/FAD-dependent oxidoreductase [Clostridiales bacterium]|nr:NAD(P)/FAD-dependent oxidoreductase [Clostridiales bacterium]